MLHNFFRIAENFIELYQAKDEDYLGLDPIADDLITVYESLTPQEQEGVKTWLRLGTHIAAVVEIFWGLEEAEAEKTLESMTLGTLRIPKRPYTFELPISIWRSTFIPVSQGLFIQLCNAQRDGLLETLTDFAISENEFRVKFERRFTEQEMQFLMSRASQHAAPKRTAVPMRTIVHVGTEIMAVAS